MSLSFIDLAVVAGYVALTVGLGFWVSKLSSGSLSNYFLAGNKLPWYLLGLSNASGMFDVGGTMWMVGLLVVYGLKSVFIPWLWPVFNQIFLMMFLAVWLRRSDKLTGAEWMTFRFGDGAGARASHLINVVFALIMVVGMLAFGFLGIGKLVAEFSPWRLAADPLVNEKLYGLIVVALTTLYSVKGGMYSVVVTEVLQFFIKLVVCIAIGWIAFSTVSANMLHAAVPHGWDALTFGWKLDLDWDAVARAATPENRVIATSATATINSEGYSFFALFMGFVTFQAILKSLAGPAPNYDMQRLLSARSPSEAAKISGFVNIVLLFPRYLMIAGMAVLAVVFIGPEWTHMQAQAAAAGKPFSGDFDAILPWVVHRFLPPGLLGLTLAGLLSAFMATYSASLNAAPAYVVNDIYRKYIRPDAPQKTYVRLSYVTSFLFAVIAAVVGWQLKSFNDVITWITTGLYGGYTVANVVKWYWWRLNGTGYAASMIVGVVAAMWMTLYRDASGHAIDALAAFPWLVVVCLAVAVIGSYLTPPTDMATLKAFYGKTRPWGLWGPVLRALQEDEPGARGNRDLGIDIVNVVIGIVWQTALTASAIFLIIHAMPQFWLAVAAAGAAMIFLKFSWWDRLRDEPR